MTGPAVVAVGGGHGLAATLRACQPWAGALTAVVSVADDGGSSGRIRSMTGLPAVGDLRRCLTSLADPGRSVVAAALERRFPTGDPDGHNAGNLLLAALAGESGDVGSAAVIVAELLGVPPHVAVLPASSDAVDLVATMTSGDVVRGQVAVEEREAIDKVTVHPPSSPPKEAVAAIADADLVVLGPGSLYGSVLAAVAVEGLADAITRSPARRVFVCNLRARPPETAGYDVAAHVDALRRHGVTPDVALVHPGALPLGAVHDVEVVEADVTRASGLAHDPDRLGAALRGLLAAQENVTELA